MLTDINTRKIFILLSACSDGDERIKTMLINELKSSDNYECILEKDDYICISDKAKSLKNRLDNFVERLNSIRSIYEGELILKELMTAYDSLKKSTVEINTNSEVLKDRNTFFIDLIHKEHIEQYNRMLIEAIKERLLNCIKTMNISEFISLNRPKLGEYEEMLKYYGFICDASTETEGNIITNFNFNNILEAFDKEIVQDLSSKATNKNIILTNNPYDNICAIIGENIYYRLSQEDYYNAIYNIKEMRVLKGCCCFCGKKLGIIEKCNYTTCKQHRNMEEYERRC